MQHNMERLASSSQASSSCRPGPHLARCQFLQPPQSSVAYCRLLLSRRQNTRHNVPLSTQHGGYTLLAPQRCRRRCQAVASPAPTSAAEPSLTSQKLQQPGLHLEQVSVVYKFGGSSVADADRMQEVAAIVCSFPEHYPCVVLSAMGKTTNLLLQAGTEAVTTDMNSIGALAPLRAIKELHRATADKIGVDTNTRKDVERLLNELQLLLTGISILKDLTPRSRDTLVSFGERLSTRLFAALLHKQGVKAQQFDACDLGIITTDDFTNADVIYDKTLPAVRATLTRDTHEEKRIPVVTGFLGRGVNTQAITTLGRGGSDLTATVIGAALKVKEVQVWKDVDGVLTSDPRICGAARPVPLLTFDEATELAFFGATVLHPQAMQPALQSGNGLAVRVKNSYNRSAPGTLIATHRDMADVLMTSIVVKNNVTLLDVVSTRMLGEVGFLARVFSKFEKNRISVDVVATSEISISLTLDPSKIWERDLVDEELNTLVSQFAGIARVTYSRGMSIISLICNVERTSQILERVFKVLGREGVNVKMMSQGASKTNISLIISEAESTKVVQALHKEFFESPPDEIQFGHIS